MAGIGSRPVERLKEALTSKDSEREPRWAENFFIGSEVVVEKIE